MPHGLARDLLYPAKGGGIVRKKKKRKDAGRDRVIVLTTLFETLAHTSDVNW